MRVATGGGRGAPWASYFCETNVRTYVRDGEGRSGIWFFSLDAARLGAVAVARTTYRLPYFWSSMRTPSTGPGGRLQLPRRWPGPGDATSQVRIRIGEPFRPGEVTTVITSSPPGGSCSASPAPGTGSRGPATSHGPCTGPGPRRRRPADHGGRAARSRRASPWCITPPASMSASVVQRSQPGSGRPARRRAASESRRQEWPPRNDPETPSPAAPAPRPANRLSVRFVHVQRAQTELITVIHRERPPATTQSARRGLRFGSVRRPSVHAPPCPPRARRDSGRPAIAAESGRGPCATTAGDATA